MKQLPIGNTDFKEIITKDYYYVDKTKTIEELLERKAYVVLFPRPRRFGKSSLISTLDYFFNVENNKENKKLFKGLYIEKSEYFKEMGKYPVINLNFKGLKKDNYKSFYNDFVKLIQDLYSSKDYIYKTLKDFEKVRFDKIINATGTQDDYETSLKDLINWLERYYKSQVVILIDEYDVPIQEGYLNGYYKKVINLIRGFISTLKDNNKIKLVVFTGVLRVSKESLFSDLNNVKVYTMLDDKYTETFGFTESETKELLEYYNLELTSEVNEYYDGYKFSDTSIYNPWSILNYAESGQLLPYWVNTSGGELIQDVVSKMNEEDKRIIFELLEGKNTSFDYDEKLTYNDFNEYDDIEKVLNLLYASGYLTYDKEEDNIKYFRIPNNEVKEALSKIMQRAILKKTLNKKLNVAFIENILNKETEEVEIYLNKLLESSSYFDLVNEMSYQNFLLGVLTTLNSDYIIKSNRESGTGRSDIIIEDKERERGIIVELKVAKKESEIKEKIIEAKKQIKKNKYIEELELDKVKDKKEMIIVFYKKKVVVK